MHKSSWEEVDLAIDYLTKMEYDEAKFFPKTMDEEDIMVVIAGCRDVFDERNQHGVRVQYIDGYLKRVSGELEFSEKLVE